MPFGHVRDLVGEHTRHLAHVGGALDQAAIDVDVSTGHGEGIHFLRVDDVEVPGEVAHIGRIGELAADMSLSQATVTTILDRLEKRQLVFRKRSQSDKRKVHAYLTDAALEMLKNAPIPLQDRFTREFSKLQEWEQTMIISSLKRVAQMMDAQHLDASPVLDIGMLDRQDSEPEKN